jgi:hypothetical protein
MSNGELNKNIYSPKEALLKTMLNSLKAENIINDAAE